MAFVSNSYCDPCANCLPKQYGQLKNIGHEQCIKCTYWICMECSCIWQENAVGYAVNNESGTDIRQCRAKMLCSTRRKLRP